MPHNLDKSLWGGASTFDALLADIGQRSQEFEEQGFISQDVIERFQQIGIYRALVPKRFNGDEKSPAEFLQAIEAIAAADGSAGWVASFGMSPAYLGSLPLTTIEKIWENSPDVVFAGGIFPPQPAERVNGGFKVSGRWKFASGSMGASLCGVGIVTDDGGSPLPRVAVMPREQVNIDSTWDVHGLVATGSNDLVLEDVMVPEEWTFIRGGAPTLEGPFFSYPSLSFATQVLSVVTLGIARGALDIIEEMASKHKSITGAPGIGDRQYAQIDIAKAEAKVRASKAFFYEATEDAWHTIMQGDKPSSHQVSMLRLSSTHLTRECAKATTTAYHLAGMVSTFNQHRLSRFFRDAMMCTQHAFMGEVTFQNAGAMFFGNDPLPGYL